METLRKCTKIIGVITYFLGIHVANITDVRLKPGHRNTPEKIGAPDRMGAPLRGDACRRAARSSVRTCDPCLRSAGIRT